MYYFFPPRYSDANLDTGKFDAQFNDAISWLKNSSNQKNNLILTGGCGVGKTYLIHAFLNTYIKTNNISKRLSYTGDRFYCEIPNIWFGTMKDIYTIIRASWNGHEEITDIDELKNVDLLIIDEIGVQYGSDSERIELHEILDYRYNWCKRTVAITNEKDNDVAKIIGQRNYSRLYMGAKIVRLGGKDRRGEM